MSNSILSSTKKILGIQEEYTAFDQDIITFINTAFSSLYQLGIGPLHGYSISNDQATWSDLNLTPDLLGLVRTYVYLRVRLLFDPPATSYLIEATKDQMREFEWRISTFREELITESEPA